MPKNKLTTPDWILKGEKKPKEKKEGKTFKIRKCPECGGFDVVVVTEKDAVGLWRCGKCGWEGKNVGWEELTEEEFMKYLDEKGEDVA